MTINITNEMTELIANALNDNMPVIISSVDKYGQPWQSFYGSTHVFNEKTFGIWLRDPDSRMLLRLTNNANVSLLYRNSSQKIIWQFHGTAEIITDSSVANTIYNNMHPGERDKDPEQAGIAVKIIITKILQAGKIIMEA
jgi:general stress protein 26